MTRFARASLTLKTLLVVGHAMASANLFDDGDEVSSLSESLLSKSVRIVGGVEVSIVHSSPICKTRSAHIACAYAVESAAASTCVKRSSYTKSFHQLPTQAQEDRYPYLVSMTSDGSDHFCGGSLIAKDTVLTAA
jgi:hypothetical protein